MEQEKPKREIVLDTDAYTAFGAVLALLFVTLPLIGGTLRLIHGVPAARPFSWWTLAVDTAILCTIPYFVRDLGIKHNRTATFATGLFCGAVLAEIANMFITSWGLAVAGGLAMLTCWILVIVFIVNWFRSKRVPSV